MARDIKMESLHRRYMADYEYRMMLANYEKNCKELGSYFVDVTKLTEETKKKRYDLGAAAKRIIDRNKER